MLGFFDMGVMIVVLKQVETVDCVRGRLKMSVKVAARWLAHTFRTHPGMPSGLVALRVHSRQNSPHFICRQREQGLFRGP